MLFAFLSTIALPLTLLLTLTSAHSGHDQQPLSADADWATVHLAEEHHISNFDAGAFFSLHDYDTSGGWTPEEITRTYGLDDEYMRDHVSPDKRREIVEDVMRRFDKDGDGVVSRGEFLEGWRGGERLKDFGASRICCKNGMGRAVLIEYFSWARDIMEMMSMSMRFIILRSIMTRVCLQPHTLSERPICIPTKNGKLTFHQTPARKTSHTLKTLPTSLNTTL